MTYESNVPTPYATRCHEGCGLVYMTEDFYTAQMKAPNCTWRCARCGQSASWDDDIYEKWLDEHEPPEAP